MRRKTTILILILILLVFVGCIDKPEELPKDPVWGTPGYTLGNVSQTDMISDFVNCSINTAGSAMSHSVSKTNPYIGMDLEAALELYNHTYIINFKLNYDYNNNFDTTFILELRDKDTGAIAIGAYFYGKETESTLFMRMGETKVRIPVYTPKPTEILPINLSNNFTSAISFALNNVVKIENEKINYEYRNINGQFARNYNFKVDLGTTLVRMSKLLASTTSIPGIELPKIDFDFIIKSMLGVSIEDIKNNKLPKSIIEFDISTVNGKVSSYGFGKLSNLKLSIEIDASETNTQTIFAGKAFKGEINLTKIDIKNSLLKITDINRADYISYKDKAFRIKAETKVGDNNYNSVLDFKYDADINSETKFNYIMSNASDNSLRLQLQYQNERLKVISYKDNIKKEFSVQFDLRKLFDGNYEHLDPNNVDFLSIFSYMLGAVRLNSIEKVGIIINPDFFKKIVGIDINDLANVLDQCSEDELKAILENNGVDLSTMLNQNIQFTFNLKENFLEVIDTIVF